MGGKKAAASSAASFEGAVRGYPVYEKPQHGEKSRRACLHRQLHKTKFCTYFLKGACHYGSDCAFAHNCTELQAMPDLRKTRVCKDFLEGGCTDESCTFAHGEQELISTGLFHKMSLCKWNEKGKCRNGSQCRFAHGSAELRDGKASAKAASIAAATQGEKVMSALSATESTASSGQKLPAKEPEPMKVLQSRPEAGMEPGTSAAALAAATAAGLSFSQSPFPSMNAPWLGIPDAAAALQTLTTLEAWRMNARKAAAVPLLSDVEQLRTKLSAISAQCSQMQYGFNLKAEHLASPYYGAAEMQFPIHEGLSIAELAMLSELNANPLAKMRQPTLTPAERFALSYDTLGA